MSALRMKLWVGLAGLGISGCGARSDVYCPLGDCGSDDSSASAGGGAGNVPPFSSGAGGGGTVDPPDVITEPPPSMEMPPDIDLPVSGRGELCPDGPRALGPIVIDRARDLEGLRGCEEIQGDLSLVGFITPDLGPLISLRRVMGTLHLGMSGTLTGLESLQQVWSLTLDGLEAPNLAPLRNLTLVGVVEESPDALIHIRRTSGFTDLSGLSGVSSIHGRVAIDDNPQLISLQGLRLGDTLDELNIVSNPSLVDLGDNSTLRVARRVTFRDDGQLASLAELGALSEAAILTLDALAITSLDELQALARVTDLTIRDNPELVDVEHLSSVEFSSLTLARNERLETLPVFETQVELQQLQIRDNTTLRTGPSFPNVATASRILITRNPPLTRIDGFPLLTSVGTLEVRENSSLLALELGALAEYTTARIVCNPVLAESSIVPQLPGRGENLEMRGNLDSIEPCQ